MRNFNKRRLSKALKAGAMLTSAAVPAVAIPAPNSVNAHFESISSMFYKVVPCLKSISGNNGKHLIPVIIGAGLTVVLAKIFGCARGSSKDKMERVFSQALGEKATDYLDMLDPISEWWVALESMVDRQKGLKGAPSEITLDFIGNYDLNAYLGLQALLATVNGFENGLWVSDTKIESGGHTQVKFNFMTLDDYITLQKEPTGIIDEEVLHKFLDKDEEINRALSRVTESTNGTFYSIFNPSSFLTVASDQRNAKALDLAKKKIRLLMRPGNTTLSEENKQYAGKILNALERFDGKVKGELKKRRKVQKRGKKKDKLDKSEKIRLIINDREFYEKTWKSCIRRLRENRYLNVGEREGDYFLARIVLAGHIIALNNTNNVDELSKEKWTGELLGTRKELDEVYLKAEKGVGKRFFGQELQEVGVLSQ